MGISYYLSDDAILSNADMRLGDVYMNVSLAVGQNLLPSATFKISATYTGPQYVIAVISAYSLFFETNTANNVMAAPINLDENPTEATVPPTDSDGSGTIDAPEEVVPSIAAVNLNLFSHDSIAKPWKAKDSPDAGLMAGLFSDPSPLLINVA